MLHVPLICEGNDIQNQGTCRLRSVQNSPSQWESSPTYWKFHGPREISNKPLFIPVYSHHINDDFLSSTNRGVFQPLLLKGVLMRVHIYINIYIYTYIYIYIYSTVYIYIPVCLVLEETEFGPWVFIITLLTTPKPGQCQLHRISPHLLSSFQITQHHMGAQSRLRLS